MSGEGVLASFREGIAAAERLRDPRLSVDGYAQAAHRQAAAHLHGQVEAKLARLPKGWRVATRLRQSDRDGFRIQLRWDTCEIAPDGPAPNPNEWTIWGPLP